MTEMITRSYEAQVDSVMEGERSVVARINTGVVDEYRTVIDPMGGDLRDYNSNPPVLWQHGKESRGSVPIGRGIVKARKTENDIIGKCIFAKDEFSQQLFEMYKDGTLRGWSINMIPSEASPPTAQEIRDRPDLDRCETIYRKWKLKEFSAVAIPGNNECLTMLVSRGMWTPPGDWQRTMTESEGGMASGGAAVQDDDEDRSAVGPNHSTLAEGAFCQEGECERCDKMRCMGPPEKRSAPFIETDGGAWWINTYPNIRFNDARLAQECLDLKKPPASIADHTAVLMGELKAARARQQKEIKEVIDLYRYGRI